MTQTLRTNEYGNCRFARRSCWHWVATIYALIFSRSSTENRMDTTMHSSTMMIASVPTTRPVPKHQPHFLCGKPSHSRRQNRQSHRQRLAPPRLPKGKTRLPKAPRTDQSALTISSRPKTSKRWSKRYRIVSILEWVRRRRGRRTSTARTDVGGYGIMVIER